MLNKLNHRHSTHTFADRDFFLYENAIPAPPAADRIFAAGLPFRSRNGQGKYRTGIFQYSGSRRVIKQVQVMVY
jgi:hypothetical protein